MCMHCVLCVCSFRYDQCQKQFFRSNKITVTWDPANSPYCGEVLHYQVVISSDEYCNIMNDSIRATSLSETFSNLKSNTSYTITVSAVNRAGIGMLEMINITTAISTGQLQCYLYVWAAIINFYLHEITELYLLRTSCKLCSINNKQLQVLSIHACMYCTYAHTISTDDVIVCNSYDIGTCVCNIILPS